ncbi:ABC transporter permease [Ulvibacterium sp.]|uniref:ABC transporter permease n=1 Tax=Ulvibacterium sp. TaxID=2665914 RepID=UPI002610DBB9|nr:ABC transporter permease [Ulvibacterium sp.]
MFKNYLKIAWRNLWKNKGYSAIHIGGLGVGIAVVLLIGLWVHDELTFNTVHKNYDHVAKVLMNKTINGEKRTRHIIPYPLGDELRNIYGDHFEHVVMSSSPSNYVLSKDEKQLIRNGAFMEEDAMRMFSLPMVSGNWNGLMEPNSIVLSRATARMLLGNDNPIGQQIRINNALDVLVTGVFEDLPFNSELRDLKFIAPWELYVSSTDWVRRARDENLWDNNSYQLFAQISPKSVMDQVSLRIRNAVYDNLPKRSRRSRPELFLHPMKDWHLKSSWKNGVQTNGPILYVWLFGLIGIFVLLLACINFMNLSTARSLKRAKEVGVRKVVGSNKRQLIGQFLTESLLTTFFAFLLAVVLVLLGLSSFNQLANKQIVFPMLSLSFWSLCLLFIMITSILAGSYPALYLSAFRPVKVLKGKQLSAKSTLTIRKGLVVLQFTISVLLVLGTLVIVQQIQHTKDRPIGYDKEQLVMMEKKTEDYEGKYNLLRQQLKTNKIVAEVAESSSPLTEVWNSNGGFDWEGKDPDLSINLVTFFVSHDYGKAVGWDILEGRDFSRSFASDSTAFILNEAALAYMGLDNPVGKTIRWGDQDHEVIGIVGNIVTESPFEAVKPAVYTINYDNTNWMVLSLLPKRSVSESLAGIASIFKRHVPNVPFDYHFVDDAFAKKFRAEERIGKLSGMFSVLAIFISCLGLFGLASFMAERRTKEIGIRKVLGASILELWKMLSKEFLVLVSFACLVAVPIAVYFMGRWLENYEYRAKMPYWIFLVVVFGALLITLFTVSFQSMRAARQNPIKSLRTE